MTPQLLVKKKRDSCEDPSVDSKIKLDVYDFNRSSRIAINIYSVLDLKLQRFLVPWTPQHINNNYNYNNKNYLQMDYLTSQLQDREDQNWTFIP